MSHSDSGANQNHFPRTFAAESVRAVAAGFIETGLATFGILIAVARFDSSPVVKSILLGSPALGLLASIFLVPLVSRFGFRASRAAAGVSLVSCAGFVFAALGSANEICFTVGMTTGIGVIAMAIPLQTHYLRLNYPNRSRGRLFSISILIRAATAMIVSWLFGIYLDGNLDRYPVLLWWFAGASALSAACHWSVPSRPLHQSGSGRGSLLENIQLTRSDAVFIKVLISAMVLGIAVLSANALRVDYLVNPVHGLDFDVKTVSLITGIVPSLVRLLSTFFWGWLFDRVDFFKLRTAVNGVFLVGIVLYFMTDKVSLILIGSGLFGLARGGGEIMFNLFVTKLAAPGQIAQYMSVHTFLAGLRIVSAPFIGFFLVLYTGIPTMVAFVVVLVLISMGVVISAGVEFRRRGNL
ncbi:MFS transporter [Verrucomicrobiales bacterium BCK34]|nr:MFS transporter [Verrucomicrobiales bacterium BCK34]